jgi:hypothetical protein
MCLSATRLADCIEAPARCTDCVNQCTFVFERSRRWRWRRQVVFRLANHEPQGLLPCLQKPAIGPSPEPDESNPHPPTLILYD